MKTLREILNRQGRGEEAGEGWTEYTLHNDILDIDILELLTQEERDYISERN